MRKSATSPSGVVFVSIFVISNIQLTSWAKNRTGHKEQTKRIFLDFERIPNLADDER